MTAISRQPAYGALQVHVVIVGINYAPEVTGIAPFTTGLAEHVRQLGHRVTVLTSVPHYPQWEVFPNYRGHSRLVEEMAGVEVRRTSVLIPRHHGATSRVLHDSSFAVGSLLNLRHLRPPDLVMAVSPPVQSGLVGSLLARRCGVPSILLVKDLPLEAAISVGLMREGAIHSVGRALERLVYRLVNHIVVISPSFNRSIASQGVPAERISVIPDWANLREIRWRPKDIGIRRFLGASELEFLVVYSGNMGHKQGLETVLDSAKLATNEDRLKVVLIGEGTAKDGLLAKRDAERIENVRIFPLQPTDQLPGILAAADVFLLSQVPNVVDSVAPSKLLTYMAAGRPIVAAVNSASEAARVVRAAGSGLVVPPGDPGAVLEAIRTLQADTASRETMGRRGQAFVEKNYSKGQVLEQWDELLRQLLPGWSVPLTEAAN